MVFDLNYIVIIDPNIRLPLLSIKLNNTTVNKKKAKLKMAQKKRHRHRNFFSCCIFIRNCSARGTSNVKSVSGRVDGCEVKQKKRQLNAFIRVRKKNLNIEHM